MKAFQKVIIKMAVLIMPFFTILPISIWLFPMHFMDVEYARYLQNKDWGNEHEGYYRILIMGDSEAKSAWLPEELSEDTYNFSLEGATAVDEYYCLKDYLKNNDAPEYLIYSQSAGQFTRATYFWPRMIYFHRMEENNFYDLLDTLDNYEDTRIYGEKDMKQEFILYKYYFPVKYSVSFLRFILGVNRYEENVKNYQLAIENRGQMQIGNADRYDEANEYAEWESFEPNEILDSYFRKLIELCEEYKITFVFQTVPYNKTTYTALQNGFVTDYSEWLQSVQNEHPGAMIDHELSYYDNSYFGDAYHLNNRGTILFSREMRKKYSEIFDRGGES